jgi:hypothetical protein
MGRPKGSVNKPKDGSAATSPAPVMIKKIIPAATTPDTGSTDATDDDEAPAKGDDAVDTSRVVFIDKLKTWGIVYGNNRNYVTLIHRDHYAVEQEVNMRRWGLKIMPAGSYGNWQTQKATFPSTDIQAVEMVAKAIYQERMAESLELTATAKNMKAVWAECKEQFSKTEVFSKS